MTDTLIITLRLPGDALSPTSRAHEHKVSKEKKLYGGMAYIAWREAAMRHSPGIPIRWHRAAAQATFFWPFNRPRAFAIASASLKCVWDQLKQLKILPDDDSDHLTHLPTAFRLDRSNPRVEITLTMEPPHAS